MRYYIYKLTFQSGATYIGEHLEKRPNDKYITSSKYFRDNLGIDPLIKREILIELKDEETMHLMETICIMQDKRDNPKNVNGNLGAYVFKYSSYRGRFVTEETRKKCSEASKKRIVTEETKRKISEKQKGVKESQDTCIACKNRMIGNQYRKGTKTSDIGRKHLSEARRKFYENGGVSPAKGKKFGPLSEERKEKIRQSNFNREYKRGYKANFKNPEERAKKISNSLKGKPSHMQSDTSRKQISDKLKGRPKSEETKNKMRQAKKDLVSVTNEIDIKYIHKDKLDLFLKENKDWRVGRPRRKK